MNTLHQSIISNLVFPVLLPACGPTDRPQSTTETTIAEPTPDSVIVPGERFGPVTAQCTELQLIQRLGPKNVERAPNHKPAIIYPGEVKDRIVEANGTTLYAPRPVRLTSNGAI